MMFKLSNNKNLQRRWKSWKKFWTIYKSNRLGIIGIVILVILILLAIFAEELTPYGPPGPNELNLQESNLAPSEWTIPIPFTNIELGPIWNPFSDHPFGTTKLGFDVYTLLFFGLRVSLAVAIISGFFVVLLGTIIGVSSAYVGGKIDAIIMRITEIILVIPPLPLLLILASVPEIGGGTTTWELTAILIVTIYWPVSARLIRSQALSLKERTFILSAKAAGASTPYIIFRHILPNVFPLMSTMIITAMRQAILFEATLAYLGFTDPLNWSLGFILNTAQAEAAFTRGAWWMMFPPAILIALIGISFAFIGLSLDAIVNPRFRKR
jgi:peptide/nickel transport system permease protein